MRPDGKAETPAEYIRRYYRVPAWRGRRVVVDGSPGRITGFRKQYLWVRFDPESDGRVRARPVLCHPTWRVEYPLVENPSLNHASDWAEPECHCPDAMPSGYRSVTPGCPRHGETPGDVEVSGLYG